MHLHKIEVRATGRKSLRTLAFVFFGTGIIVDVRQERGTK
jgi:hypothetical protein